MNDIAGEFCALDFGTSNSVLLVRSLTGQVKALREKSLLFFPDDNSARYEVGNRALAAYEEHGRRGRLLQSLKSLLPHTSFEGGRIGGDWRTLESLLTLILAYLRESASRQAGYDLKKVVLGRPARFSTSMREERIAEERLKISAIAAGFNEVRLILEPVAAAAAYQTTLSKPELALIADLGAGTSDFSVARLEPTLAGSLRNSTILASSGLKLGGDEIDGLVMWHKLTHYFGRGTKYKSGDNWLDIPVRIFRDLCHWDKLSFLRGGDTRHFLDGFIRKSKDPEGLRRLALLIDRDLGYGVFRAIERAKISLSISDSATIVFHEDGLQINEKTTVVELRGLLEDFEGKILSCLAEVLHAASVEAAEIETVFLTGGTSLFPVVRGIFAKAFGAEKLRSGDPFDSVASGLLELAPR
jgi:hypothetical chaperone protein